MNFSYTTTTTHAFLLYVCMHAPDEYWSASQSDCDLACIARGTNIFRGFFIIWIHHLVAHVLNEFTRNHVVVHMQLGRPRKATGIIKVIFSFNKFSKSNYSYSINTQPKQHTNKQTKLTTARYRLSNQQHLAAARNPITYGLIWVISFLSAARTIC